MVKVNKIAAQGDLLVVRVEALPVSAKEEAHNGKVVVAHSETGHHHVAEMMDGKLFRVPGEPLTCYLQIAGSGAEVVHNRPWDTHASLSLPAGIWMMRNQSEYSPEGMRRVTD